MNYTQITMGIMLSLFISSVTADCLSSIKPEKDGVITWSDLAKYDACLKSDNAAAIKGPLTLSQDTWAAACSSGSFTANKCFGGNPATNANTLLVLKVTNLYAIANLSLTATYPAGSIWIGYFPEGLNYGSASGPIPAQNVATQAVCGAFTEIGWGIPGNGIDISPSQDSFNVASNIQVSTTGGPGGSLTMFDGGTAATLKTPLYIICVGRTSGFAPAALSNGFSVPWPVLPSS